MKGHFRCYAPRDFRADSLLMIEHANKIISEYEAKGYTLTLRQLYYQFVARALVENSPKSYDRLGALISDARLAGLVSWTAIEDRGRNLRGLQHYTGPGAAVREVEQRFNHDLWKDQPYRPEVWVEKHALEDVVGKICNDLRVDFFAIGGYNSQSAAWRAGRRMARYIAGGQRPIVFHLGDHDPSGLDMTRDNRERLQLFAGVPVQVARIALNRDQVERYGPPPNPAKVTDVRFAAYQVEHGDESWELDALDPEVIHDVVKGAVMRLRDEAKWNAALLAEAEDRRVLKEIIEELGEEPADEEEKDDD